jgi:2-oxoisovalerate dehydrogenase E1 component
MPGISVDGNDVLAVRAAAGEAVTRARSGAGPTLLECKTYRTRAHAEGMGDFSYRTRAEVEEWKTRCPIRRLRDALLEQNPALAGELDALEEEVARLVAEAHQFAVDSPWPEPVSATDHVFAATPEAR